MTKKMWFVFDVTNKMVLSCYGLRSEALEEAEKVKKELGDPDYDKIEVIVYREMTLGFRDMYKLTPAGQKKQL